MTLEELTPRIIRNIRKGYLKLKIFETGFVCIYYRNGQLAYETNMEALTKAFPEGYGQYE